jgi:hypothetical protein
VARKSVEKVRESNHHIFIDRKCEEYCEDDENEE